MPIVSIEKFAFLLVRVMSKRLVAFCEELSSPKTLVNALVAGIALVLDELEALLILVQHIQGVRNSEAEILGR